MTAFDVLTPTDEAAREPDRTSSPDPTSAVRTRVWGFMEAYALVGLLGVVVVFFSAWGRTSETFATAGNFQAIVGNQAVVAIVALASLVPLVCDEWDLSVGATAGVSALFAADALTGGMTVPATILMAATIGLAIGGANALIVTRLRVNGVITTLATATIISGAVNHKSGGLAVVGNIPSTMTTFGTGTWLGIPRPAYALGIVALGVYYLLEHTPAGRHLFALGSNPRGARLVGLPTRILRGGTFVIGGGLCGLAGALQVARAGGAAPNVGPGFTLPALAAAFLSAASIKPGRYNVGGTLVALFFLATLNGGLNLAGAKPYVASYVNGAALIVGVALAAYLGRKRTGDTE